MYAVGSVRRTDLLDTKSGDYRSCNLIMILYIRKIGLNSKVSENVESGRRLCYVFDKNRILQNNNVISRK
jgi:hypothetical protein